MSKLVFYTFNNIFFCLDGMTLTLDKPLEYEHLGVSEVFGDHTVEFRGLHGFL